ncbi:hypothetical protein R1flu_005125 [Riccia fluitans]|uniref:Uncharacterized protein n=1 Tax=Riccia fluitans TaxID=41844 RepID=A0ABD1YS98_9MARC
MAVDDYCTACWVFPRCDGLPGQTGRGEAGKQQDTSAGRGPGRGKQLTKADTLTMISKRPCTESLTNRSTVDVDGIVSKAKHSAILQPGDCPPTTGYREIPQVPYCEPWQTERGRTSFVS